MTDSDFYYTVRALLDRFSWPSFAHNVRWCIKIYLPRVPDPPNDQSRNSPIRRRTSTAGPKGIPSTQCLYRACRDYTDIALDELGVCGAVYGAADAD